MPSARISVGVEDGVADAVGLRRERRHGGEHGLGHGGVVHVAVRVVVDRGCRATTVGHVEGSFHAGVAVSGDRAVHRVEAGLDVDEVEVFAGTRLEVVGRDIGVLDADVVDRGAVVGHVERAPGADRGRADGELGEPYRDRVGVALTARGDRRLRLVDRPDAEPDADDGDQHGEQRSEHGDDGEVVAPARRFRTV